jgi:hypothetical protein
MPAKGRFYSEQDSIVFFKTKWEQNPVVLRATFAPHLIDSTGFRTGIVL